MGGTIKYFKFQNSEYGGHFVGPKDSESQNFRCLAFKGEAVGVARDKRKKIIAQSCFNFPHIYSKNFEKFFLLKTCFLPVKSHKT
jgi:hypothetical protein